MRTVTEAIATAMEHADDCDGVIIIMREKNGAGMWFGNGDLTISEANFMLDNFKMHLLNLRKDY
jgi:hypothetical protein